MAPKVNPTAHSMGGLDRFSNLPPEILLLILTSLDTATSLVSVTSAAPQVYRGVFATYKKLILQGLIEKTIKSPGSFREAFIAVSFERSEHLHKCTGRDWLTERFMILRGIRSRCQDMAASLGMHSVSQLTALCAIIRTSESWIDGCCDYFSASIGQIQNLASRSSKGETPGYQIQGQIQRDSLSVEELSRLQRACFRYFTLLAFLRSPQTNGFDEDLHVTVDIASAVLIRFAPWEVEEIVCLHNYHTHYLRAIVENLDIDAAQSDASISWWSDSQSPLFFVKEISTIDGQRLQKLSATAIPSWLSRTLAKATFPQDTAHVRFPDGVKVYRSDLIQYLATRGPEFLAVLKAVNIPEKRRLISSSYYHQRPSLYHLFYRFGYSYADIFLHEALQAYLRNSKHTLNRDDPHYPNYAWLRANGLHPIRVDAARCHSIYREWGYVFWDRDRLESLGVLREAQRRVEDIVLATEPPHGLHPQIPSVQRHLRERGLL